MRHSVLRHNSQHKILDINTKLLSIISLLINCQFSHLGFGLERKQQCQIVDFFSSSPNMPEFIILMFMLKHRKLEFM